VAEIVDSRETRRVCIWSIDRRIAFLIVEEAVQLDTIVIDPDHLTQVIDVAGLRADSTGEIDRREVRALRGIEKARRHLDARN